MVVLQRSLHAQLFCLSAYQYILILDAYARPWRLELDKVAVLAVEFYEYIQNENEFYIHFTLDGRWIISCFIS